MLSAPATIPATSTLTSSDSPARSARAIAGTKPAADTKLSSSNQLEIVCGAWESCTEQAPFLTSVTAP